MSERTQQAQAEERQVVRCPNCGEMIVVLPPKPPLARFEPAKGTVAGREFERRPGKGGKP